MRRYILLLTILVIATLSGCFINTGGNPRLDFDGNMSSANSSFSINGILEVEGGNEPRNRYDNICISLYDSEKTVLLTQPLGSIAGDSSVEVSARSDQIPEYIVFHSADIWDGTTEVPYYVRSEVSYQGYQLHEVTEPGELPVQVPEGC